jgi:hypothetical protein
MTFEEQVLAIADQVLQSGETAEFDFGTLFVHSTEQTSRRIFSKLFREFEGRVTVSVVGHEYAFDFTA